jgi:sporadic carbohydrate cluster 2OG-Fe(II) oxygenase
MEEIDIHKGALDDIKKQFEEQGYVIAPVVDQSALQTIKAVLFDHLRPWLPQNKDFQVESVFNNFHNLVDAADLNAIRVNLINNINSNEKFLKAYYRCFSNYLNELVGNELVMQKKINLSIQVPQDGNSLLPPHADALQGDSPFEIVAWLPMVDVFETKSMFILDKHASLDITKKFVNREKFEFQVVSDTIINNSTFIDMKFGECLLFNQNQFHGNIENKTSETRFSMNCRFKSLFSPYRDKLFGEFFSPVELRPMTKIGLDFINNSGDF